MKKTLLIFIVSIITTFGCSVFTVHACAARDNNNRGSYGTRFLYRSSTFKNNAGTSISKANVGYKKPPSAPKLEESSQTERRTLPPKAVKILKKYYLDSVDPDDPHFKPHPSELQKEQLLEKMDQIITVTQLDCWFTNTRRRNHGKYISKAEELGKCRK